MSAGWVSECRQHRAVLSHAQSGLQISKRACHQRSCLLKYVYRYTYTEQHSRPLHVAQMPIKGHATCISHTGMSCRKTTHGFTRPSRENSLSFPGLPAAASRMPAKCVSPGAATASWADGACVRRTEQPQSGLPASWLDWRNL